MSLNIIHALQRVGIPSHLLGYEYLKSALSICLEYPAAIRGMTKELYPAVAKSHKTTGSKVERAIRHAVGLCWARCDRDTLITVFGPGIVCREKTPANGEFIAALAEQLRMEGG